MSNQPENETLTSQELHQALSELSDEQLEQIAGAGFAIHPNSLADIKANLYTLQGGNPLKKLSGQQVAQAIQMGLSGSRIRGIR